MSATFLIQRLQTYFFQIFSTFVTFFNVFLKFHLNVYYIYGRWNCTRSTKSSQSVVGRSSITLVRRAGSSVLVLVRLKVSFITVDSGLSLHGHRLVTTGTVLCVCDGHPPSLHRRPGTNALTIRRRTDRDNLHRSRVKNLFLFHHAAVTLWQGHCRTVFFVSEMFFKDSNLGLEVLHYGRIWGRN